MEIRYRAKGKQVQVLYDLVTVSGEPITSIFPLTQSVGKEWAAVIRKPGNLPIILVQEEIPRSRGIDRTQAIS